MSSPLSRPLTALFALLRGDASPGLGRGGRLLAALRIPKKPLLIGLFSTSLQRRARCCAAATASTTRAPVCATAAGRDQSATSPSRSASTLSAAATAPAPTETACAPSAIKGRAVHRVRGDGVGAFGRGGGAGKNILNVCTETNAQTHNQTPSYSSQTAHCSKSYSEFVLSLSLSISI